MRIHRQLLLANVILLLTVPAWAGGPPKCAVRSGGENAPAMIVDGQPYSPLMFVGNNQFDRDDVLLDELRLAANAGIPFHSFQVRLGDAWDAERAAEVVDRFCSAHPEGYFYVRVWLGTTPEWLAEHPEECVVKSDGTRLDWVSPASEVWREYVSDLLRDRVREIARGPHGKRFIGVCLTNMQTGEWFYRHTNEFMDYSEVNLETFRRWLQERYQLTADLQSAWGSSEVTFETAIFPTPEQRDETVWGPFRHPVEHRPAMDMQQFQSEQVVDAIAHFARVVKRATSGKSLVGVFYGYTMELNNNGPRALANSGHLAFARLLECDDVDLVHAPYSYFERKPGQPGHLHLPVDSLALHNKLGILEEDTFTHLAQEPGANLVAPGWRDRTANLEETLSIARRNFGNFLTHRCGLWFFDLLSDGRWNDREFWASTVLFRRMAAELRSAPVFEPEVAVLVDEEAVHLMQDTTYPYLLHALSFWRSELDSIGTPVGYYLQSDLRRVPDSVRVLILPNAFRIAPEQRKGLEKRLKKGVTVLWCYAPDVFGPDGPDPDRISAATQIAVEPRFDQVPMRLKSTVSDESIAIDEKSWQPRFVVTDPDAEVLATYSETDEVCAAMKVLESGVSVYTGAPRLPRGVLRHICERAGVHLYRDSPGMTAVLGEYLVIHTDDAREHEFRWPVKCETVERVLPYRQTPLKRDVAVWTDKLPARYTAIYRCRAVEHP